MPGLILWKNQEISRLKKDMDRMITRFWEDFDSILSPRVARGIPAPELSETEDRLLIRLELPDIEPEDLDVSLSEDVITVRVDTTRGGEGEQTFAFFSRSFQLPCRVIGEEVQATYSDGVLNIVLPKCKGETVRAVKIKVL